MNSSDCTWQKKIWSQICNTFFCDQTAMIYDYITSFDHDHRFDHLPSPEEIALDFPNPCGWSTGMEDCALNGGLMLELLYLRDEMSSAFACKVAEGLIRGGSIHGTPGFVARSLSIYDGKRCYSNSSRDQFTLATYGVWRLVSKAKNLPKSLRQAAVGYLASVADYCEKNAVPSNDYNLMRLDAKPAIVSTVWHCSAHEAMRLPMIYGIAADVTGEPGYQELMLRYAHRGLQQTLELDPHGDMWDMPVIQMQLSLNFFFESNLVAELKPDLRHAMNLAGDIAMSKLPKLIEEAENFSGNWNELYINWRNLPMYVTPSTIAPDGRTALFGGKSYLNPAFRREFAVPNELMRGIGNYLATIALSPDVALQKGLLSRVDHIARKIDFSGFSGIGILPFLYGYTAIEHKIAYEKGKNGNRNLAI